MKLTVLLDTNALLWAVGEPRFLSQTARLLIADRSNEVLVSAASAWEIATKVRIGRLPQAAAFEGNFLATVRAEGYRLLAIEPETALRSGRMPGAHGDPFDRMIAAQALELDVPVISPDAKLDQFLVRRIW